MMCRYLFIAFVLLIFTPLQAQVKANDSLYQNFNHHNRVDSLYLYQSFKWKNNEFELIGVEMLDPFLFELSSKGGLINITTKFENEDFVYKGTQEEFLMIKLDTNNQVYHLKKQGYLYEESEENVESYFYFFPDQTDRIYRYITTKKRQDILVYFISPKD